MKCTWYSDWARKWKTTELWGNSHQKEEIFSSPKYEVCPETIWPFWISSERVTWPSCNLAASQRRHYCTLSSGVSKSAVRRRWLSLCTAWSSHSRWLSEQISFITTMHLPIPQLSCRLFWLNIASLRSVSPPTAHIWLPATSGFSQS